MRILGLDPGLRSTGWGVIDRYESRLVHVAHGAIKTDSTLSLADRLGNLYDGLSEIISRMKPQETAIEQTFVNMNPQSTLKLGQARGVILLAPAKAGLPVAEYSPNQIKKALVGGGHADKAQIARMVRALLPSAGEVSGDAADALAIAICHSSRSFLADMTDMTRG